MNLQPRNDDLIGLLSKPLSVTIGPPEEGVEYNFDGVPSVQIPRIHINDVDGAHLIARCLDAVVTLEQLKVEHLDLQRRYSGEKSPAPSETDLYSKVKEIEPLLPSLKNVSGLQISGNNRLVTALFAAADIVPELVEEVFRLQGKLAVSEAHLSRTSRYLEDAFNSLRESLPEDEK